MGRFEAAALGGAFPTLSPASLQHAVGIDRLVLPSPNGSTIASSLPGSTLIAGCLRNALAVGEQLAHSTGTIAIIAAGERWPDHSLRPALEDAAGAAAILAHLPPEDMSPEARAVLGVSVSKDCVGARELIAKGFADDVEIAFEQDCSDVVPWLSDGAFTSL